MPRRRCVLLGGLTYRFCANALRRPRLARGRSGELLIDHAGWDTFIHPIFFLPAFGGRQR